MRDLSLKTRCKSGDIHKVEMDFYGSTVAVRRKILTSDKKLAGFFEHRKFGNKYYIELPISFAYREIFHILKWVTLHPFRVRKYIKSRSHK